MGPSFSFGVLFKLSIDSLSNFRLVLIKIEDYFFTSTYDSSPFIFFLSTPFNLRKGFLVKQGILFFLKLLY